jgi:nitric oxide reductase NorD protein
MTALEARSDISGRVCFSDYQRTLWLFAQGLAGRYLHLKLIEPGPSGAGADRINTGDTILLPADMGDFATAPHNLGAYRISILHQIGYWVEGTFDFDPSRLSQVPRAAPRTDPPQFESALEGFFAAWQRPALLRRVFVTVEDLRIDAALRRRYPGARKDLDRVLAHALAGRPAPGEMPPLASLLEGLVQYSLGAARATLLGHDSTGLMNTLIDLAAAVERESADVHDSARAALSICGALEKIIRWPPRLGPETLRENFALSNDPPSNSAADASPDEALRADPPSADSDLVAFRGELNPGQVAKPRRGGHIATTAQSTQQGQATAGQPNAEDLPPGAASPRLARTRTPVNDGPRSFLYDEWDYHQQAYLTAWCRVYELKLRGDDFGFIDDVRRRHSALASRVRRQFGLIKPQSWRRIHRSSDGDELELDGVIEAVIDRRTGHANDSRLYLRRDRATRDVAAAFLVDMSASTDFPVPDRKSVALAAVADPPEQAQDSGLYLYGGQDNLPVSAPASKRRVIDISKDALALMCDALQTLGDSFAVYGFSGDGRENVEFHVAKDFGDKLSARTWAALAAMQPRRSTRMGAAIRHALSKLAREPASMKVLIIVSDGYPEDRDYGSDRSDREYGIEDTARALREAERAGIVDFCVTIDPAGHDYLRRMCAESRYLVIDDVMALPRELTKVYRTLTA